MSKSQRGLLVRHLFEEELEQAIESAQETDKTRFVQRLCYVKNLYQEEPDTSVGIGVE